MTPAEYSAALELGGGLAVLVFVMGAAGLAAAAVMTITTIQETRR